MEKNWYNVELVSVGDDWAPVYRAYRDLTGKGLAEVKSVMDAAPCIVLQTESMEEAEKYKASLEKGGATVRISNDTGNDAGKITSPTVETISKGENYVRELKKVGTGFVLLNFAVVLVCAVVCAWILQVSFERDFVFDLSIFIGNLLGFIIIFGFPDLMFILTTILLTDHIMNFIVVKTVKKNTSKHHFDNAYKFQAIGATLLVDTNEGRIAYVSSLNPWRFQMISAKDIEGIGKDHAKGIFSGTTHHVYFQFYYHGKRMRFSMFRSNHYRPLTWEIVQQGLKNAAAGEGVLKHAKQIAIYRETGVWPGEIE
ncbi:MAG: ribosomal protein L7/L12 [Lachnospiraceae bacterium]|nr:ribosomal protein L7/L12 [Lachnospiraceae bacterium]